MKLFYEIKKNLISFMRDGKIAIICFLVFPMVVAAIYGTMQKDAFEGKSSFKPIVVEFKYNESSKEGQIFKSMLNTNEVKSFINIDAEERVQCKVTIDSSFKNITIEKISGDDSNIDIVQGFMNTFSENINQYQILIKNLEGLKLGPKEEQLLASKLNETLKNSASTPVVKESIIEGYKTLGAREYYTISMFSFIAIMVIMTLVKGFYKEKKQGVIKRCLSTPNSSVGYLFGYLNSSFLIVLFINTLYLIINKILGIAFFNSFIELFIVVLLQSLLEAATIALLIAFIESEEMANAIIIILTIIPLSIGGVFFNVDVIDVKILKVISGFSPNSLILNAYKNLAITGSCQSVAKEMIIMAVLSLTFIVLSFIKVRINWGEQV